MKLLEQDQVEINFERQLDVNYVIKVLTLFLNSNKITNYILLVIIYAYTYKSYYKGLEFDLFLLQRLGLSHSLILMKNIITIEF